MEKKYKSPLNLLDVQYSIEKYGSVILRPRDQRLFQRMSDCGKWARHDFFHKGCGQLIKSTKVQFYCEVRYCFNPKCLLERYARTLDEFSTIKDLKGLRSLQHVAIGFKPISLNDFKTNFSYHKKRFEKVLNSFWSKLKKAGVELKGIRVLDYSFEKDGQVYVHYHLGIKPFKAGERRQKMIILNQVRKKMLEKQVDKCPFSYESFGYKPKGSILSYLAKRSAGLYKHGEGKNLQWNVGKGNLIKNIKEGKYFGLKDFLTLREYMNHFYGKRHYVCVGGLPRGSIVTDSIESLMPDYCPFCKVELTRHDIRVETTLGCDPPDGKV